MQTAIVVLAFTGLSWLHATASRRWQTNTIHWIVAGIAVVAVLETPLPKRFVIAVPDLSLDKDWSDFIREQTPEDSCILTLPFNETQKPWDYRDTTRWMYRNTLHGVPMLNGYSGYVAREVTKMQKQFVSDELALTPELLVKIRDAGTHFIVTHANDSVSVPDSLGLPVVYKDSQVRIYRTDLN